MIRVAFASDSLRISGHSGTATRGNDPLCAAISALAQALAYGLENHAGTRVKIRKWEPGEFDVSWGDISSNESAKTLVATIKGSIEEFRKKHPEALEYFGD